MKKLTEADFDAKYTEDTTINSKEFPLEGRLETFGQDAETLKSILKKSPKRVWTAIEGEDGQLWYVAGYHYVNRVYHLITNEEWSSEDEEYCID